MRSPGYEGPRAALNHPRLHAARHFIARSTALHLVILVSASLATRIAYLLSPAGRSLSPDEAVFGLMALKIMALEEFPIYCWEAHYAGAPVSYAAALVFKAFGIGAVSLRAPMLPLAVLTVVCSYFIYRRVAGVAFGFAAALFIVFCPYDMLFHSSGAFGGYAELLAGMALIMLLTGWMRDRPNFALGWFFVLGALSGFTLYVIFLALPVIVAFAVPAVLRAGARRVSATGVFAAGALLGAMPMLVYNATTGGSTVLRAAGRSLSVGREVAGEPVATLIATVAIQKLAFLGSWFLHAPALFGSYVTPEGASVEVRTVAGYAFMAALALFVARVAHPSRREQNTGHRDFAWLVVWTLVFGWAASLTAMRHLIPFYFAVPIALHLFSGPSLFRRRLSVALLATLCALHGASWFDRMTVPTPKTPFNPRPIATAMETRGVVEFYGAYWAVYPLMFSSEGRMVGAPLLLNEGDTFTDRRPGYTARVQQARDPAFVFTPREAPIRREFEQFLARHAIQAKTLSVPDAVVFHGLSRPVVAELVDGKTRFTL